MKAAVLSSSESWSALNSGKMQISFQPNFPKSMNIISKAEPSTENYTSRPIMRLTIMEIIPEQKYEKGVPEWAVSHATEIVQKSVFQQKEGSCVMKNDAQHEPAIIPCDWLFTTPHTSWSLMMIIIVIVIIKIGPKINKENWNLAKMGPKNDIFMK